MEKLLRLEVFSGNPQATNSADQWDHWYNSIQHYTTVVPDLTEPQRLSILTCHVSDIVYGYISQCTKYDATVATLRGIYVRQRSTLYGRHMLVTRCQDLSESQEHYIQELIRLGKDCLMEPRTVAESTDDLMQDAFLAGIASPAIRLWLLEEATLTFQQACDKAHVLQLTAARAEAYNGSFLTVEAVAEACLEPAAPTERSLAGFPDVALEVPSVGDDGNPNAAAASSAAENAKCYFCDHKRHPHASCPARNCECHNYGKKGHFVKMCQAKSTRRSTLTGTNTSRMARSGDLGIAHVLRSAVLPVLVEGIPADALLDTEVVLASSAMHWYDIMAGRWDQIPVEFTLLRQYFVFAPKVFVLSNWKSMIHCMQMSDSQ
uniref:uncharacterized protein n=1 Tax=Myxine glutinosa TaxID=7769 RepID=UPI00358FA1D2